MKKRSLLAALLAGVMALGLCACGGSSEPAASGGEDGEEAHVVLKLGHMKAEGSSTDLDIKDFCAKVTEESGGTIEFEVYPSSTLGDYSTMVERMGIGCTSVPTVLGVSPEEYQQVKDQPFGEA